jgi:esterase
MKLYAKQYSENGEALIILHGLFGQHGNWGAHAKVLAQSFAVYGFDARNHGLSEWADSMSYPEMAMDVLETMDALSISKAHFVGHSMGGKTAMELAMMAPERVNRLVIVALAAWVVSETAS